MPSFEILNKFSLAILLKILRCYISKFHCIQRANYSFKTSIKQKRSYNSIFSCTCMHSRGFIRHRLVPVSALHFLTSKAHIRKLARKTAFHVSITVEIGAVMHCDKFCYCPFSGFQKCRD